MYILIILATFFSNPVFAANETKSEPSGYLSSRFAEASGDNANGIKFTKDLLAKDPENKELNYRLYLMLVAEGNIEEATELAKKVVAYKITDDGNEFPPELLLVANEIKLGNYKQAKQYITAINKNGFNSLLIPLLDAWLKLGNNEIKSPFDEKDIIPNSKVVLSYAYLNAAYINEIAGFSEAAAKQYEEATKDTLIGGFRPAEALANYYDRKNLIDKKQKFVDDYIAEHGESLFASKYENPLVSNANEGVAESFYTIANIFHGVRSVEDEIITIKIALFLRPDFPAARFLLANAYELKTAYGQAISAYQNIDNTSPYFYRGRISSAYDENELGNKDKALVSLDKLAEEKPDEIMALLAKGDILRINANYKEAIASYSLAEKRIKTAQKQHWIVYFSRGVCYEQSGDYDKFEQDLKKALELSPNEADALNYLGYSWLTRHKNEAEAKKLIEQAYDINPEDAHIIDSMGYALYNDGNFESAVEYFEQALERIPDDPTTNEHLGDGYWQLGRKVEARNQWQHALDNSQDDNSKKSLKNKIDKGIEVIKPLNSENETE